MNEKMPFERAGTPVAIYPGGTALKWKPAGKAGRCNFEVRLEQPDCNTMLPPRQTVSVRGTDLELLVLGRGKPLLFLHGKAAPTCRPMPSSARSRAGFASSRRFTRIRVERPAKEHSRRRRSRVSVPRSHRGARAHRSGIARRFVRRWIAAEIAIRNATALSHLILSAPLGIKVRDRNARTSRTFSQ